MGTVSGFKLVTHCILVSSYVQTHNTVDLSIFMDG